MSILITAAASASAYKLKKALNTDALLGDYLELPEVMLSSGLMLKTPNPASASFPHQMLTLCLDHGITTLYPLRKQELFLLSEARLLFEEFAIQLYVPQKHLLETLSFSIEGKILVFQDKKITAGDFTGFQPELLAGNNGIFSLNEAGTFIIYAEH